MGIRFEDDPGSPIGKHSDFMLPLGPALLLLYHSLCGGGLPSFPTWSPRTEQMETEPARGCGAG